MSRTQFAIGSAIFLAVIVAGIVSEAWLDRRFAATEAGKRLTADQRPDTPETQPPSVSGACVDKDGSWKNWSFPNVPMLSPKCSER